MRLIGLASFLWPASPLRRPLAMLDLDDARHEAARSRLHRQDSQGAKPATKYEQSVLLRADSVIEERVLDHRGQLVGAALGFAGLPRPSYDLSLWALRTWFDSWSGIGHVAVGMARQGYDLQLTRYDERAR